MFNFKKDGIIKIGGVDVDDLANKFSTPLIAYDQAFLENKIKTIKNSFSSEKFNTTILFASKSASMLGLYRVLDKQKMSFDVVSSGEIFIALKAGVSPEKLYFHGNNKTIFELEFALKNNVKTFMVDNFTELKNLNKLVHKMHKKIDIIMRVNPHVVGGQNPKIATALDDSKFGESIKKDFTPLKNIIIDNEWITFRGFHAHIGSQIISFNPFNELVLVLKDFIKLFISKYPEIKFDTINFGGGFGVIYTNEKIEIGSFLTKYIRLIEKELSDFKNIKRLMIEPGRAVVAESAVTIYTIGGFKETPSGKTHIYVDGGMTDNIRPSLYDAKYTFEINNNNQPLKEYIISGKCCESGDTLSKNTSLANAKIGQRLVAYTTGAYTYSMSSNYNQVPKPIVIMVKNNIPNVIVKRESFNDLIKNMI